jgi:hypothetical protein
MNTREYDSIHRDPTVLPDSNIERQIVLCWIRGRMVSRNYANVWRDLGPLADGNRTTIYVREVATEMHKILKVINVEHDARGFVDCG